MKLGQDMTAQREAAWLAPYAMHSADSEGRQYPEPPHPYRGPYQRDRDRILHSAAFRRLSHKTQVFMGEMGDYHRTRLTHTLEVASIARTIARALRLNEDLVEALALAHDIGHPPFGHSGEEVLDECLRGVGGFDHNYQALRICELLETRYPEFPGLNLTREVLEGQLHRTARARGDEQDADNGGSRTNFGKLRRDTQSGSSDRIRDPKGVYPPRREVRNPLSPLLEVQVVDVADSIAYDAHDADDSLEIGLLQLGALLEVPLWHEASERVARRFAALNDRRLRRAIVHELIDWQVSDVVAVARKTLQEQSIDSVAAVRRSQVVVRPSLELAQRKAGLEDFLFERVYRHPEVLSRRCEAQQALREMYARLLSDPERLPAKFRQLAEGEGVPRTVGDYLAGMTDRFALDEYRRTTAA